MWVCTCVYAGVNTYVQIHTDSRGPCQVPSPPLSTLYFENWTYSSWAGQDSPAREPQGSSCLSLPRTRITDVHYCTWLFTWELNSDPYGCTAGTVLSISSSPPPCLSRRSWEALKTKVTCAHSDAHTFSHVQARRRLCLHGHQLHLSCRFHSVFHRGGLRGARI